jgi:hypothetical protein
MRQYGWRHVETHIFEVTAMSGDDEQAALRDGLGRLGGRAGGGWGARFAARFLADDVHEIDVVVDLPAAQAVTLLRQILVDLQDPDVPAGREGSDLQIVMGSGAFNLNPAVITVTVEPNDLAGSTVHIRGVAKEGLIKQHAGRTAANRVAAALAQHQPGGQLRDDA